MGLSEVPAYCSLYIVSMQQSQKCWTRVLSQKHKMFQDVINQNAAQMQQCDINVRIYPSVSRVTEYCSV